MHQHHWCYRRFSPVPTNLPWIVAESLDRATRVSAVARRYGLHPSQLFVWRQRLAAAAARGAPGFVPVLVTEDSTAPAEATRPGWSTSATARTTSTSSSARRRRRAP